MLKTHYSVLIFLFLSFQATLMILGTEEKTKSNLIQLSEIGTQ